MSVERVGVVGCGLMGAGIAEVCARAGLDTVVREVDAAAAEAGQQRIYGSFDRAVSRGRMTEEEREAATARLRVVTDLAELADRELVIEAVVEDETLKAEVFAQLDRIITDDRAILATNTSSIPIMRIASATNHPERVVGMHFFNPVQVLQLVEVVSGIASGEETVARAERFAADQLGKVVVHSRDRAGFIVNALLIPYILSAMRMLEAGFATTEDIDRGMVEGCNHPMGPLQLADLIGLDTTRAIAESLYEEFREPQYAPPPILSRMVDAGWWGRKSGRGFYDYT